MNSEDNNKKVKSNRKNKQWLRSRDQKKHPKIFDVKMIRNADGSFHLLGNNVKYLRRINQFASEWVPVDTRDFACELRNSPIKTF